jgi:hypothetical protein
MDLDFMKEPLRFDLGQGGAAFRSSRTYPFLRLAAQVCGSLEETLVLAFPHCHLFNDGSF